MDSIIYYAVGLIVSILTFVFGRYVFPKLKSVTIDSDNEFIKAISTWAYDYVVDAKNTFPNDTPGYDKKAWVSERLSDLLDGWGVDLSEEQISALIEAAYDQMKRETADIVITGETNDPTVK